MNPDTPNAFNGEAALSPMVLGLRVRNVQEAITFYGSIGFQQVMLVPDKAGNPLFCVMRYGSSSIVFEAVETEMPFADTTRERSIRQGPRGLGVTIGLDVPDLLPIYEKFRQSGCEIATEPTPQFFCEALFIGIDPFGYAWEFRQGFKERPPEDQIKEAQQAWVPTANE